MPLYTFECPDEGCGRRFDLVYGVTEIHDARPRCPSCRKRARRVFVPPQVIQDTLPEGEMAVSSLKPISGDEREIPKVSTRSELKRLVEHNNKKYGLDLEHAG